MKEMIIKLINIYQATLSPDHGLFGKIRHPYGYCKYYPSCSEYAKQAIAKHGIVKGISLAAWRIARCNPFTHGGYDPIANFRSIRARN